MRQSVGGLMDEGDPEVETRIRRVLDEMRSPSGVEYHGLRHRNAGNTLWVEFHLLFPQGITLGEAHTVATRIEDRIRQELGMRAEVISHLESLEDHHAVHSQRHFEHFPE